MNLAISPETLSQPLCDNDLVDQFRAHQAAAEAATEPERQHAAHQAASDVWAELYLRHQPTIFRSNFRSTGQYDAAEDLTQETFMKAYSSIHTYSRRDGTGNFGGWLHRIAQNTQINKAHAQARRSVENTIDPVDFEMLDTQTEPSAEQVIDEADLTDLLVRIPACFREAVVLVDVDGNSYDEAASILGIQVGTVRSRLHRGRRSLAESIINEAQNDTNPDSYIGELATRFTSYKLPLQRRATDKDNKSNAPQVA